MITLKKFFAVWCGPCKAYDNILDRLAGSHPDIQIERIDVDEDANSELVSKYGVRNLPYTVIEVDGEIKFKSAGIIDYQTLVAKVSELQ